MQGPYPWSNLDEWLINKYIGADLQVSKAGTSTWMPLGDLLARRRRGEGKPTGSAPAAGATVAGVKYMFVRGEENTEIYVKKVSTRSFGTVPHTLRPSARCTPHAKLFLPCSSF